VDWDKESDLFVRKNQVLIGFSFMSLFFVFLYILINFENHTFYKKIFDVVYNLSIAMLSSAIFYIFIVYIPERKRSLILRSQLKEKYHDFKLECIYLFFRCTSVLNDNGCRPEATHLTDIREFRSFFKEPVNSYRSRWALVFDSFYHGEKCRKQLEIEIGYFLKEIEFILVKLDFDEDDELRFFKSMSSSLGRFSNGVDDDLKTLFRLLWELFAAWSWVDGYYEEDFVIKRIDAY